MKQRALGYRDRFDAWLERNRLTVYAGGATVCFVAGSATNDIDWLAIGGVFTICMVYALSSEVWQRLGAIQRAITEIHRNLGEIHGGFGDIWTHIADMRRQQGHADVQAKLPWSCECGQVNRPGRTDCALCDRPKP